MNLMWLFWLIACNPMKSPEDSGTTAAPGRPTYHGDVAPILRSHCEGCHQEGGVGGFSLTGYDDVRMIGDAVLDAVVSRRMPPFLADNSGECQTYADANWLTEDEIGTLRDWHTEGMKEGSLGGAAPLDDIDTDMLTGVTHTLSVDAYNADFSERPDDYRCFVVDPGLGVEGFLTAFEAKPSNPEIAHHLVIFAPVDDAAVSDLVALDDGEAGPGYSCFGGPGVMATVVATWGPGRAVSEFPEGTGVRLQPSRPLIVQMHYSDGGTTARDATIIDLRVEAEVERELTTWFFSNNDLALPPSDPSHEVVMSASASEFIEHEGDMEIFAVLPHMHKLGTSINVQVDREDGTSECVVDISRWDFNWQMTYTLNDPVFLGAGDQIRLSCTYDTSTVEQTTYFGDGSSDEMCLLGMYTVLSD
jgi:hypothetical protein